MFGKFIPKKTLFPNGCTKNNPKHLGKFKRYYYLHRFELTLFIFIMACKIFWVIIVYFTLFKYIDSTLPFKIN